MWSLNGGVLTVSVLDIHTKETDNFTFFSSRSTASTMSTHLRTESMVATPKPNSEKILEICELGGPQEAASLCMTKGTEVEIQRGEFNFSLRKLL